MSPYDTPADVWYALVGLCILAGAVSLAAAVVSAVWRALWDSIAAGPYPHDRRDGPH
jgi:hypothetical protein